MNKPLNINTDSCEKISSNCVIWQGPDILCLNLCKGDTITEVVNKMATKFCNLLDDLNVDNYDISCLDVDSCPPETIRELIQILISTVCNFQAPAGEDGTDGTDGQDGAPGQDGANGSYVVVTQATVEQCPNGGAVIQQYSGITNNPIGSPIILCNPACDCQGIVSFEYAEGDFAYDFATKPVSWFENIPAWMTTDLQHTISTGNGLYSFDIDIYANEETSVTEIVAGIRVNGAVPSEVGFAAAYLVFTPGGVKPAKIKLYLSLTDGDIVSPDFRIRSMDPSGTWQMNGVRMVVTKENDLT